MAYLVISNRRTSNTTFFENPEELEAELALMPDVDTLIFVFWSWIVPPTLLNKYRCFGMHTGPLLEGKGRGGSPIDNLKKLGVTITTLCAFEMNEKIDGGRVVLATPLYLDDTKENIIWWIDWALPPIVKYLTAKQPDIPEYFKRIK